MKTCPSCKASVTDSAKFCVKCGFNIKKYEEESALVLFCPECGTKIEGGTFCPECGYNAGADLTLEEDKPIREAKKAKSQGDDLFDKLDSLFSDAADEKKSSLEKDTYYKALSPFTYEEHSDGSFTVTGLKDKSAITVTVPSPVVSIADGAFKDASLVKVELPEGLLTIGKDAFFGAKNLMTVNIPSTVMIIGEGAFSGCELLELTIPDTVKKVGESALFGTVNSKRAAEAKSRTDEKIKLGVFKGTPLFWRRLEEKDGIVTLICDVALSRRTMHNYSNAHYGNSELRKWLNGPFYKSAFNDEEKKLILDTPLDSSAKSNPGKLSYPAITDKVYLLSYKEVVDLGLKKEDVQRKLPNGSTAGEWYWTRSAFVGENAYVLYTGKDKTMSLTDHVPFPKGIKKSPYMQLDGRFKCNLFGVIPVIRVKAE